MILREIVKVVCLLILIVAGITAVGVWSDDRPTELVKQLRIATIVGGIIGMGGLVWVFHRRDIEADYLSQIATSYFNRGGFCFLLRTLERDGQCYLQAHVQNQYEHRCRGQIAIRPKDPIVRDGKIMQLMVLTVDVPPAGFCVITAPMAVPVHTQGRQVIFQVGASVDYPDGRGRTLRFQDGLVLRSDANFRNRFGRTLTVLGAMGGVFVWSTHATVALTIPANVRSEVSRGLPMRRKIIWQLGDPKLEHVA